MPVVPWISQGAGKVIRDNEQVAKSIKTAGDAYDDVTRRARELERVASKINRDHETAKERFTRMSVNAKQAFDQEKIGAEKLQKEMTRLTVEYLRQSDANEKLRTARTLQHVQIQQEIAALPKLIGSSQQLIGAYTQQGVALGNLAVKQGSAFGPSALSRMQAFGAKAAGIAAIVGTVTSAIRDEREANGAVGRQAIGANKAWGALGQLDNAPQLRDAARRMQLEGGFETLDEAAQATFEIESGEMMGDRAFWSRVAQSQLVKDVPGTIVSASLVKKSFGGTSSQLLSEALAAAGPAAGAEIGDIEEGLAAVADEATTLGFSRAESQAAISRIAEITGSGKTAGTQTESLFRALIKRGFANDPSKRGNMAAMLEAISEKDYTPEKLQEFFGRAEASSAFAKLKDVEAFETRVTDIEAAGESGLVEKRIGENLADERIATARFVRSKKASAEMLRESRGLRKERIDAAVEESYADAGTAGGAIGRKATEGANVFGIPIPGTRTITPAAWWDPGTDEAPIVSRRQDEWQEFTDLVEAMKKQNALVEEQNGMMREDKHRVPVGGRRE